MTQVPPNRSAAGSDRSAGGSDRSAGGLSRREALLAGAGLFVAFDTRAQTNLANPPVVGLDGMLAIGADGRCELLTSKTEFGQGINVALCQIAAEEMDLPLAAMRMPHADTARSPDHGNTAGSLTLQIIGPRIRLAAATARAALARMGAERLGVTADAVETRDGFVRLRTDPARTVAYGALIGGRRFDLPVDAQARVKPHAEWRVAGRDAPRPDVLAKATGGGDYLHNLRLPGMLHARVVHAPRVGAKVVSVDAATAGRARVVRRGDLVAVVAEREWHAVQAQRSLGVTWDAGRTIPAMSEAYTHARNSPVVRADTLVDRGDPAAAIAAAPLTREATYTYAVQSHATIGPSCAVAQFEGGTLTVHSGSQAPFDLRAQIGRMLGLEPANVRVVYHPSSGCFGRNGLEDAAAECAVLAMELAPRPVRLQWMRHDEMANEPKGPPTLMTLKGGVSAEGRMLGWQAEGWVPHATIVLVQTTASALINAADGGMTASGNWQANANPPYDIPAAKAVMHRVSDTPFRPSWIRTPGRLQNCFAVESFTDELAAAAGQDPVAFRLAHMPDPRARAVIEGAAQAAGWDGRPSPRREQTSDIRRGRGIAYIRYDNVRTYAAAVMAVEVDTRSGEIRVTDCWAAQDCGQVINPDGIRLQVEGQVIQTISRTLREEITWEGNAITSLDWGSYRLLRFPEVPNISTVIIDRPDQPMWGAGEMVTSVVSAAVGNAVFDATGARLRHAPFTPERVKAALAAA